MNKEKKKRSRFRPTWVDGILLILGVSLFLLGWRYFRERQHVAEPTLTVEYLLCLPTVDLDFTNAEGGLEDIVTVGALVTTANGATVLGTVREVWEESHLTPTVKDGTIAFVETPDRVDLYVEVIASAVLREGEGLRVSDIRIAAGGTGDFRIGGLMANGAKIVSVKKGELLS